MRRGAKPKKIGAAAKRADARKSPKDAASRVRDLEKRLADALEREAEALKREAEAQERQAATSEILRVISSSPTDTQPVLETLAASAARLCDALDATIFRVDGDVLKLVAHCGPVPTPGPIGEAAVPLAPGTVNGRAVLERRTVHVADLQAESAQFPEGSAFARRLGQRTQISVPLLKDGTAIGTIAVRRSEVRPFTDKHIALLETFANQAVIAIENVRMFTELEARNRDLSTALDQQTATSEVLHAIAHTQTDVQPVFDTIVRSATRLCRASFSFIFLTEEGMLFHPASHGSSEEAVAAIRVLFPRPLDRETAAGTAILTRSVVHVPDVQEQSAIAVARQTGRVAGYRSLLSVPMLGPDGAVGAIAVARREPGRFSDAEVDLLKTFAAQAVIAIENVRLFNETKEALQQQTATSEILRVISSSPTDVQPVFDAIVQSTVRLCDGLFSTALRFDGELIHLVAQHGVSPEGLAELHRVYPTRPTRGLPAGRAILERGIVHIPDAELDPENEHPALSRAIGWRSALIAPMLRDGAPIGVITVSRATPGRFSESEIGLLQTFADQAVIAIENVRLFNELQEKNRALTESLEQQTATADILQVISRSPTEVGPVFEAVVTSAARLCEAHDVAMLLVDGDDLRLVAGVGPLYISIPPDFRIRLTRGSAATRAVVDRATVHIHDFAAESEEEYPVGRELARRFGHRSMLAVPLLREGVPIGVVCAFRLEVRPFPDQQIALLRTFADQAVIAIENVRLFTELQEKNCALTQAHAQVTESLEQQTATADILRVIANSPTEVQPVFDTIAEHAARLCGAEVGQVARLDGGQLQLGALYGSSVEGIEAVRQTFPRNLSGASAAERVIRDRAVVHIPDVLVDEEYGLRETALVAGFRAIAGVPMLHEDRAVGSVIVGRVEAGPFNPRQIELLRTFADQAVIAIENVRLFRELEARNRALTESLEQQTATSEILRVISSSPTDVQPVFDAIAASAKRLCDALYSLVFRFDGEKITLVANDGASSARLDVIRSAYPARPGRGSVAAQAILERRVIAIADAQSGTEYPHITERAKAIGYRSLISVPMLRGDTAIGAINVVRVEALPFSETQIELLKTFADQAVIAVENVRLFAELQEKNRALTKAHAQVTETLEQQTATSEILRVISSSPTDIQPVFDVIAQRAVELCDALYSGVFSYDNELVHLVAHHNWTPEALAEFQRTYPIRPSREGTLATWAILDRIVIHVADILNEPGVPEDSRRLALARGYRSFLAVPMMREGQPIGAIAVAKRDPERFSDKQVDLLKIFADQAVIAVENVRLFRELEARNHDVMQALEQQTATAEVLRAISSSTMDVRPVFQTIVESAVRLSGALFGSVYRFDGELIHMVAHHDYPATALEFSRRFFPAPPSRQTFTGRAILTRAMVHVPDVLQDQERLLARDLAESVGFRSVLSVPMLHEGGPVGAITVWRADVGPFSDKHIELLQTFAAQAVIAIQNERLFQELQDRTAALTRSVEQLTALGEVGRAVSSTLDLETVLTTIVSRAVQLSGLDGGVVFEYDEGAEEFVQRAATETGGALAELRRTTRIRRGEGVVGRTAVTLEPVQVPDITVPAAYESRLRENLVVSGIRAILAVPMVREGQLIGCLGVTRNRPGEFPADTIELLRTFATQSALAIQNARLYHELADKSRQLELASRHKSEFLANMSHELRTPLNAIIGFSEVLTERMFGELNEKQDEYLRDIYASGQHLLSLINDILDLSKIEAGRMELEVKDFDLPQAIGNAVTLVRERAGRRGIALHQAVDSRLGQMSGDERKIKQVLLNLLSNALKFTPEGGRVDVRATVVDGMAEIAVTDTGIGIAPEDQETVFEEFRQVGTADKKVEGTGLGLALSRKFIELHGGRIWVESQVGRGSTFAFTLPLRRDD